MSSSEIQSEVWGEASRNALKVTGAMSGGTPRAGIYARREGRPDLLVAIISPKSLANVAVRHPGGNAERRGYLGTQWVAGVHHWAAWLDNDTETMLLGTSRDPAEACSMITQVSA